MSTTKAHQLARKYGKKFAGNLLLEGVVTGEGILDKITQSLKTKSLGMELLPDKVVTLQGYIEYSPAKARKEGQEGTTIQTSYVSGLAVLDKSLYAITADKVYRIHGPFYPDVIKSNPVLNEMWEGVKRQVADEAARRNKNA